MTRPDDRAADRGSQPGAGRALDRRRRVRWVRLAAEPAGAAGGGRP